jgi:outer membrane protein OmpA-like peptidoglycan-associated protein
MQTNKFFGTVLLCFFTLITLKAQVTLEGYTFEEGNRGYLNQVKVTVYKMPNNAVIAELVTDADGHFVTTVDAGEYRILAKKDIFNDKEVTSTVGTDKVFLKMEMKRKPGYLFDATIADARDDENVVVDAILGATIEIYNRTQRTPVMVLPRHPAAFFHYTFEQGNHYTILLRKPGYLAKRIEAYVNIEGCIICVNGVSNLRPGITDNLTEGNSMGTLLCNIEMEKVRMDKRIALQNIYYDYNKSNIRTDAAKELDKAVQLMVANPGISVELGSHTDARGSDVYNQSLSQQRAESAVAYIIGEGVDKSRITAKGYGEAQIANRCANGVTCSEEEHQKNRRTELRITGISQDSMEYMRWESLENIVREEEMKAGMKEIGNQKEYKVEEKAPTPKVEERPKQKQMPEANNSVPMPKKQMPAPKMQVENEKTVVTNGVEQKIITTTEIDSKEMALESQTTQMEKKVVIQKTKTLEEVVEIKENEVEVKKITTLAVVDGTKDVKIIEKEPEMPVKAKGIVKNLPETYNGFNVEIALTDFELPSDHPIFQQHNEIFVKQEGADKFSYYIGNFENIIVARNYYQSVAIPKHPSARLCQYINGKMTYTK